MTRVPEDNLDEMLSEHFSAALDGQRGRAVEAFRRFGSQKSDSGFEISDLRIRNSGTRRAIYLAAGVPTLIAACLAVVVTLQYLAGRKGNGPAEGGAVAVVAPVAQKVEQVELSRDVDGGVATLEDNTPIRIIRHETVEHTQWTDPSDRSTYTLTQPVEQVGYVKLTPY